MLDFMKKLERKLDQDFQINQTVQLLSKVRLTNLYKTVVNIRQVNLNCKVFLIKKIKSNFHIENHYFLNLKNFYKII